MQSEFQKEKKENGHGTLANPRGLCYTENQRIGPESGENGRNGVAKRQEEKRGEDRVT